MWFVVIAAAIAFLATPLVWASLETRQLKRREREIKRMGRDDVFVCLCFVKVRQRNPIKDGSPGEADALRGLMNEAAAETLAMSEAQVSGVRDSEAYDSACSFARESFERRLGSGL